MVDADMALPEIAGYPTEKYPYQHGDPHGDESHGEGYPGTLEHPGEDIPSQIIGPEEVHPQPGDFLGAQSI